MNKTATLLGVVAILLWSMSVALTRSLSEALGAFGAGASIYTISGLLVWLVAGKPHIKGQHPVYLYGCGLLFVVYMTSFALAIGLADSRQQTLELGLINYLWPSLTLMFALPLLGLRVRWWLWPGVLLAFCGVVWVVSNGDILSLREFTANLAGNPVAYGLAFTAAFAWALYSNLLRRYCGPRGALPLFLLATAATLWLMFLFQPLKEFRFSVTAGFELLLMGASTALAYLCWDSAMKKGNATLVAALSYFTPLLSTLIAGLWLNTLPSAAFWPGVGMVIAGSLLCWSASRNVPQTTQK